MNVKVIIAFLLGLPCCIVSHAQAAESSDSLSRELKEIIVTAKQPATKLVGSTLVTTISGTNLAGLGNALDVLAQLPMIKVVENSVSVIGKSNIEIYINGRQVRDELELRQLLSSNLKKVELIMAPGAAYESTTGAVVRITTKPNYVKGLSASEQFQIQYRRRCSVMNHLALSYHTGNWEMFANGNINRNNYLIKGYTTNTLIYEDKVAVVGSRQHNSSPTTTGVVKAGFNYARGNQTFGAYYRFNSERGNFTNSGAEWLNTGPMINRNIESLIHGHSNLASAYYENKFARKYLIHFDGDFRKSVSRNNVLTSYPDTDNHDVNSWNKRNSTLWAGKLFLNCPLWQGNITIGTQGSHTRTTLDYRMFTPAVEEYIPSSLTNARQTSAAMYASWSRAFGCFSLTAGARYEYVDYEFEINGERDRDVSRRDHLLKPDLQLSYSLSDNAEFSLSYKMGVVRPPYSQLTGSLTYVGRHEIEGGNPGLRDERMHDIQLFGMWKGFMLQADYTRSVDTYAYVKRLYPAPNLQLLMYPINIDISALSLFAVWSQPVSRWTPNVTLGVYRQWFVLDHTKHNKPIISYYFDNTISLPEGWVFTVNISGQSLGDMHTNRFCGTWFTMDASMSKTFLSKSLTIKLSATDIFNTASNSWTMNTYGVYVDKRQSYDRRGLSFNVTYTFQPRKSAYKGQNASEAEVDRL